MRRLRDAFKQREKNQKKRRNGKSNLQVRSNFYLRPEDEEISPSAFRRSIKRMRKKRLIFPILALFAALIFFALGFFWWRWAMTPVSQAPAKSQIFVIYKGEGLSLTAQRLKDAGLIRDASAFKILVLAKGLSGKIQAGDFRINPSWTTEEVAYLLTHGSLDIWLTFPEGWRREEYGRRLEANLEDFSYPQFLQLTEVLEGYLFPDTYLVPKDASPSAVIKILTNNFEKKYSLELQLAAKEKDLTKSQVIIFASIVERESRAEKDRPIVAGILLKRWRENWPLQADATVQYVLASRQNANLKNWQETDWWPQKLTKNDLEIDSPYNTYKYKGLPPAPICNPGLASIEAVIYPQESEYWFYLSDLQGRIHYAKTDEEHNENIEKYLKESVF